MTRIVFLTAASIVLLGLAGSPAGAQTMGQNVMAPDPDPTTAIKDECDVPSLEDSKVDSCLERARSQQETNPSADIELLTSKLEQRSVQRFDPNSMTPPTTQAKGTAASLDAPDNVTTPPNKLLSYDESSPLDRRPTDDPLVVTNGDGAKRPMLGDGKLDDGNPPDTNTDDPPPPETPSLRDDDPPH